MQTFANNIETGWREVISSKMGTFVVITSAIIGMLLPLRFLKKKKLTEFNDWSLGVDCCCYYSLPFTVHNHCITIVGFQEVLSEEKKIRYSIVRKSWWGKRIVYYQEDICGHYKSPHFFQLSINNVPNGGNYQVEVFNGFNMAYGQFKVVEGEEYGLLLTNPKSQSG